MTRALYETSHFSRKLHIGRLGEMECKKDLGLLDFWVEYLRLGTSARGGKMGRGNIWWGRGDVEEICHVPRGWGH